MVIENEPNNDLIFANKFGYEDTVKGNISDLQDRDLFLVDIPFKAKVKVQIQSKYVGRRAMYPVAQLGKVDSSLEKTVSMPSRQQQGKKPVPAGTYRVQVRRSYNLADSLVREYSFFLKIKPSYSWSNVVLALGYSDLAPNLHGGLLIRGGTSLGNSPIIIGGHTSIFAFRRGTFARGDTLIRQKIGFTTLAGKPEFGVFTGLRFGKRKTKFIVGPEARLYFPTIYDTVLEEYVTDGYFSYGVFFEVRNYVSSDHSFAHRFTFETPMLEKNEREEYKTGWRVSYDFAF